MPLINISVNKKVENDQIFLSNVSGFISSLLNKSENFVMVRLIDSLQISFAGTHDPCCFIEIKSIGSLASSKISMPISEFISTELGIPIARIYIYFQDVDSKMWSFKGKTFA